MDLAGFARTVQRTCGDIRELTYLETPCYVAMQQACI